jgi:hypothetical protein
MLTLHRQCGRQPPSDILDRIFRSSGSLATDDSLHLRLCYLSPMRGNLGLFISSADRARLAAIVGDRNSPQKHVWRAAVVLLTSDRHSLVDLQQAINTFIAMHNAKPKPFVWKADPKAIIAAAKRGHQVLETIH